MSDLIARVPPKRTRAHQGRSSRRALPIDTIAAAGPLLAVAVAVLLAVVPTWNEVWYQDDQLPTLFRTFHTDLAHHWGVVYPRLAPELGFGYGRLLHQFYPPFGVELAAWLHTLGLGFIDAARATFSLCLVSSAFGMYAYGRAVLRGTWPGALAAVAFVWAPYVLHDAHKGGVLGESIALAIMPWSLLAMHRLLTRGGWTAFSWTALTLALVILGHNISALFFVGLASLYALVLAVRHACIGPPADWAGAGRADCAGAGRADRAGAGRADCAGAGRANRRTGLLSLGIAAAAVLLALALSAIYWLPALVELPFSRVSDQRTGEFSVVRYLLTPDGLFQPSILFDYYNEPNPRFGLAAGVLTLAGSALFALAARRSGPVSTARSTTSPATPADPSRLPLSRARERGAGGEGLPRPAGGEGHLAAPDRVAIAAFIACFVVVLALQLRVSQDIWETVPLISYVQFPQRLFVFGSFAGAVVLGAVPWSAVVVLRSRPAGAAAGALVAAALGVTSLPGIYWTWPVSSSHIIAEDQIGVGTSADRRLSERRAFDDYFPIGVQEDAGQITRPPSPNRVDAYATASAGPVPTIEIVERGYLWLTARVVAEAPSTIVLHQFFFPGWQAEADGVALAVDAAGPLGLVRVALPAGQHRVRIWFGETPLRIAAIAVSLAGVLVLLAAFARGSTVRRTALALATVLAVVAGPRLVHSALDPIDRRTTQALQADVLPSARVVGLELPAAPARPGDSVPVTTIWQAISYSPRDLQTGVLLTDPASGRVLAERWGRPNRDRTPTGKWLVGELVPDTLVLRLPPDLPPGRYRLRAGLRDVDGRDRAPLATADIGELIVR